MKNIFFPVFFFAFAAVAEAQTSKGTTVLSMHNFAPGGFLSQIGPVFAPTNSVGISFGKTKTKTNGQTSDNDSKYATIGLNFSGLHFLANNFAAGANLNFFTQTVKNSDSGSDEKISITLLLAGPELRYYVPASDKTKFWLKANGSFGSAKITFDDDEDEAPSKLSQFGFGAGLAFFPRSNFSIDLGLGYSLFRSKSESTFSTQTIESEDIDSGVTLDLGFSFFLFRSPE